MRRLMDEVGILEKLRQRGHADVAISFDLTDDFVQKVGLPSHHPCLVGLEGSHLFTISSRIVGCPPPPSCLCQGTHRDSAAYVAGPRCW